MARKDLEADEPWLPLIERQIREALSAGEFDQLEGRGRPLAGLDAPYDELWWVKEKLRREGLAPVLPETLEIRRVVEDGLARIARMIHEDDVRALATDLARRVREVNSRTFRGPASSLAPLDVEAVVRRWRQAREAPGGGAKG